MTCHKRVRSASRSAALDLLLKTFANPSDIFPQSPLKNKFETISRIVPGTTPRQCARRWEELRSYACRRDLATGSAVELEATEAKPSVQTSEQHNTHCNSTSRQRSISSNEVRSSDTLDTELETEASPSRHGGRSSTTSRPASGSRSVSVTPESSQMELCQNVFSPIDSDKNSEQSIIAIHVFDEAKKLRQDFVCPRSILAREMRYFADYLLPGNKSVDNMDISVHCDIGVFDWLMRYTKRGMREGPKGETLPQPQEAPRLEVTNAASILISSHFLQMESLVEECLNFIHENISQVVSLNFSGISTNLMARLAMKFTPTEVEQINDRREKVKRKIYAYLLQQFFEKDYSSADCPANGSSLFRCKHCHQLLTAEQQVVFSCVSQRMFVCIDGSVGYQHQRDTTWSAPEAIQELQFKGYSLRDIFWWFWGTVNWLVCQRCGKPFKCNKISSCAFHKKPSSTPSQPHPCCGKQSPIFSLYPNDQDGCTFCEHTAVDSSLPVCDTLRPQTLIKTIYDTLNAHKHIICVIENERPVEQVCSPDRCWLLKECAAPLNSRKVSRPAISPQSDVGPSSAPNGSFQQIKMGRCHSGEQSGCSYDGGTEEEDAYVPKVGIVLKATSKKHHEVVTCDDTSHQTVVPHKPLEWTWVSSKSRRWNQDLQRESDEQKLVVLISCLHNLCTRAAAPKKPSKTKESYYIGGAFCRLEAEFKAQHPSKMSSSATSLRGSSGKK